MIAVQLFVIIGFSILPESPDFLYAKGRYEESKQVILKIARFNGVHLTEDQIKFGDPND